MLSQCLIGGVTWFASAGGTGVRRITTKKHCYYALLLARPVPLISVDVDVEAKRSGSCSSCSHKSWIVLFFCGKLSDPPPKRTQGTATNPRLIHPSLVRARSATRTTFSLHYCRIKSSSRVPLVCEHGEQLPLLVGCKLMRSRPQMCLIKAQIQNF